MGLSRETQTRISRIARRIGGKLVNVIGLSLRLEVRGWNRIQHLMNNGTPIVFQFWHGDMFIAWYLTSPLKPAAIVSQAGDGDIASAVLEGLDYVTFRGSSTRGGRKAYSGMLRHLRKQEVKVSAFASDGPRGPRRVMKPGTFVAAQHLNGYIIPTATVSRWALRARGWDKFVIPIPFSKAIASFGEPIKVNPKLKGKAMDEALLEASMICKKHQEDLEASIKNTSPMSLSNHLQNATWFLPFRIVLSFIYGGLILLRNSFFNIGLFKVHRVDVPVISVGNISVGGSGKTVLVQALIQHFLDHEKKPSVLSRGYGRNTKGLLVVADNSSIRCSVQEAGDESFLIAQNFPGVPVVVSENRVLGARFLQNKFKPDVIILDDAFQHRRLYRDLNLLIIDHPNRPKPHLIPWGRLREPEHNIARADIIVYSKKGQRMDPDIDLVFQLENQVYDYENRPHNLNDLEGELGLFSGLGNPDYFFNSMRTAHKDPRVQLSFPDHAKYDARQLEEIRSHSCNYWITTQKDFIKLDPAFCQSLNIYFIGVKCDLPGTVLEHLKRHFK